VAHAKLTLVSGKIPRESTERKKRYQFSTILVGACSLDVTGLLALVADTLTPGLGGAVTGNVANLAAVVALLSLSAVTGHVAESTTGVAGLRTSTV